MNPDDHPGLQPGARAGTQPSEPGFSPARPTANHPDAEGIDGEGSLAALGMTEWIDLELRANPTFPRSDR